MTNMTTSTDELRSALEARIKEAEQDLERMRAALAALVGKSTNGRRSSSPRRPRKPREAQTGSTPKVLTADALVELLKDTAGRSVARIAKQTGAEKDQIRALVKDLAAAGRIHKTGKANGTRWHAGRAKRSA